MNVGVHRERGRGVPQALAHRLDMYTTGQEHARCRVPQAVEGNVLGFRAQLFAVLDRTLEVARSIRVGCTNQIRHLRAARSGPSCFRSRAAFLCRPSTTRDAPEPQYAGRSAEPRPPGHLTVPRRSGYAPSPVGNPGARSSFVGFQFGFSTEIGAGTEEWEVSVYCAALRHGLATQPRAWSFGCTTSQLMPPKVNRSPTAGGTGKETTMTRTSPPQSAMTGVGSGELSGTCGVSLMSRATVAMVRSFSSRALGLLRRGATVLSTLLHAKRGRKVLVDPADLNAAVVR